MIGALTTLEARGYHNVSQNGAWLSLVERSVRDREVVGSNPIAPTTFEAQDSDACFETWVSSRMTIGRRFIVRGTVQGVGFRYFAVRAARQAGVVGTVRNLPDGAVEAIAEGPPQAIDQFRTALERGPSYGDVTGVDEIEMQPTGRYTTFDVVF